MNLTRKFLDSWNRDPGVSGLLERLENFQFIQLNELKTLNLSNSPLLVYYQYLSPIMGEDGIQIGNSQNLVLGKMHQLRSLVGGFGYLFEFPRQKIFHGPGCFGVQRKTRAEDSQNTQVILKSQYLTIFSSEEGVLCVGRIPQTWVEHYGFHHYK